MPQLFYSFLASSIGSTQQEVQIQENLKLTASKHCPVLGLDRHLYPHEVPNLMGTGLGVLHVIA